MACAHPLSGWRKRGGGVTFSKSDPLGTVYQITVPCGRCILCRVERVRQWAVRIVHETELYNENAFITLTYDDDHLPADKSVSLRDLQLFFKKFRKKIYPLKVRYFACGEYGDKFGRPHYHAIVFGWWPSDARPHPRPGKTDLWLSDLLTKVWENGEATIGSVTFDSAAYVAGYINKKLTGKRAADYGGRSPDFGVMSRRPGIGARWIEKYGEETWRDDFIVLRGRKMLPPAAYDARLDPMSRSFLKLSRKNTDVFDLEGYYINKADYWRDLRQNYNRAMIARSVQKIKESV